MKNISLLVVFLTLRSLSVIAQNYIWADTINYSDDNGITAMLVDEDKNVYTASSGFIGGENILSVYYASDVHLRKYDDEGALLWELIFSGTARIMDMKMDNEGRLIVAGGFSNMVNIFGDAYLTAPFLTNAFISKIDADGGEIWTITESAGVFNTAFSGLGIDNSNNIYAVGMKNDIEALLTKYNSDGEIIDSKNFDNVRTTSDIEITDDGNLFIAGTCPDYSTFDGISLPDDITGTGYVNFIIILDSTLEATYVNGAAYITFDFNADIDMTEDFIYWRCLSVQPGTFEYHDQVLRIDIETLDNDTMLFKDDILALTEKSLSVPSDDRIVVLNNFGPVSRLNVINEFGEITDSLLITGSNQEVEKIEAGINDIWIGGFMYDSLSLAPFMLYSEPGDFSQPFVARYQSEVEIDTITDSCYAFFTYVVIDDVTYFTNASVGSDSSEIIDYNWTFCDGSFSTMENPIHIYAFPTFICACLEITDTLGCTDEYCISITDTSTSVLNLINEIKIYPNPIHQNTASIYSTEPINILSVHTITGQTISFSMEKITASDYKIVFENIVPGLYFVNVEMEDGNKEKKITTLKIVAE